MRLYLMLDYWYSMYNYRSLIQISIKMFCQSYLYTCKGHSRIQRKVLIGHHVGVDGTFKTVPYVYLMPTYISCSMYNNKYSTQDVNIISIIWKLHESYDLCFRINLSNENMSRNLGILINLQLSMTITLFFHNHINNNI